MKEFIVSAWRRPTRWPGCSLRKALSGNCPLITESGFMEKLNGSTKERRVDLSVAERSSDGTIRS
jgi:hypothetical protein